MLFQGIDIFWGFWSALRDLGLVLSLSTHNGVVVFNIGHLKKKCAKYLLLSNPFL